MILFVLRRLTSAIVVLGLMISALFWLQSRSPADPARALAGDRASPEAIEATRQQLGLDRPFVQQLWDYLRGLPRLDFQTSLRTRSPVRDEIIDRLPPTLELLLTAAIIALVLGFVIGLLTVRGGVVGKAVRGVFLAGAAVPVFVVALLLVLVFYRNLGWFPASGQSSAGAPEGPTHFLLVDSILHGDLGSFGDALKHLVLPALALAAAPAAAIGRSFASALTTVLRADYIKTAKMKGISESRIMVRHVVRNTMNSALAMVGLQFGVMLGAVAIIEMIFAWPGLGNYLAVSVRSTDVPAIVGVAVVFGAIFILLNALVDIIQAIADPRIAMEGRAR